MISALFNSSSCNQLFLFLSFFSFFKKGRFAVDVIRDLMVCEVACRLSGSFLEQSGRALINRLKEESDRAWMWILLLSSSLCLCGFFVSDYSIFVFSIPPFLLHLSSALTVSFFPDLCLSLTFKKNPTLSPFPFYISCSLFSFFILASLLLAVPLCLPHLFSPCLHFHFHYEQIISTVSDEWHHA